MTINTNEWFEREMSFQKKSLIIIKLITIISVLGLISIPLILWGR